MARKRRTREHIIHDLAVNHVERVALLCEYSVERIVHDYGVDLLVFTYDENGEYENELLRIQVKATDQLSVQADGKTIAVRVSRSDVEAWLSELMPCILVLYDAQAESAYWLEIQEEARLGEGETQKSHRVTLHINLSNVWNIDSVRGIAAAKNELYAKIRRLTGHD